MHSCLVMHDVGAHTDRHTPGDGGLPTARVIESAVELARAESKLVLSHVRIISLRALTALLVSLVATSLSQVAILLLALSPVLATFRTWPAVLASVLIPVAMAVVAVVFAVRSWKQVAAVDTSTPKLVSPEHTQ